VLKDTYFFRVNARYIEEYEVKSGAGAYYGGLGGLGGLGGVENPS